MEPAQPSSAPRATPDRRKSRRGRPWSRGDPRPWSRGTHGVDGRPQDQGPEQPIGGNPGQDGHERPATTAEDSGDPGQTGETAVPTDDAVAQDTDPAPAGQDQPAADKGTGEGAPAGENDRQPRTGTPAPAERLGDDSPPPRPGYPTGQDTQANPGDTAPVGPEQNLDNSSDASRESGSPEAGSDRRADSHPSSPVGSVDDDPWPNGVTEDPRNDDLRSLFGDWDADDRPDGSLHEATPSEFRGVPGMRGPEPHDRGTPSLDDCLDH